MLLNLGVERDHITVNPNDTFLKNDAFSAIEESLHAEDTSASFYANKSK